LTCQTSPLPNIVPNTGGADILLGQQGSGGACNVFKGKMRNINLCYGPRCPSLLGFDCTGDLPSGFSGSCTEGIDGAPAFCGCPVGYLGGEDLDHGSFCLPNPVYNANVDSGGCFPGQYGIVVGQPYASGAYGFDIGLAGLHDGDLSTGVGTGVNTASFIFAYWNCSMQLKQIVVSCLEAVTWGCDYTNGIVVSYWDDVTNSFVESLVLRGFEDSSVKTLTFDIDFPATTGILFQATAENQYEISFGELTFVENGVTTTSGAVKLAFSYLLFSLLFIAFA